MWRAARALTGYCGGSNSASICFSRLLRSEDTSGSLLESYIKIYSQTETSRVQMASQLRRKSSIPIIVQVGLALAVCVNMGLLHYVEGANFTVGAGYVESSTGSTYWTNTIGGLLRPEILLSSYQRWTNSVLVSVGDTLIFEYERGTHTVFLARNKTAFTKCDFDGAVQVPDGSPTTYTIKPTDSTLFFVCTLPGHCDSGQKVEIVPLGTTPQPPPQPTPTSNALRQSRMKPATVVTLLLTSYLVFFAHCV